MRPQVEYPLDTGVIEQGTVQLGARQCRCEKVVRAPAHPVRHQAGLLVAPTPLLGRGAAAAGGATEDPGRRREGGWGDPETGAAGRHRKDPPGKQTCFKRKSPLLTARPPS